MSTKTTNYGLIKPALTDPADITVLNENWEKIDQTFKSHGRHVPTTCVNVTDWNNAVENGWYMGNNAANAPTNEESGVSCWYYGYVIAHNSNYLLQEVYYFTASSDAKAMPKYIRAKTDGKWGAWTNVTVQRNVPANAKLDYIKELTGDAQEQIDNKVNGGSIDFSDYTLDEIVEYVSSQSGRAFIGRYRLAATHSPNAINTWFRGVLVCQNKPNDVNDVSVNIIALSSDNTTYIGNIYGTTSYNIRWKSILSKNDVVDNLTSTDANKPLSAAQGKILNDKIDKNLGSSLLVKEVIKDNLEINNNATTIAELECTTQSGYKAIGIVGTNIDSASESGANSAGCYLYFHYYDSTNNKIKYRIKNTIDGKARVKVTFHVLYVKAS